MEVTIRKSKWVVEDGRAVPYVELEVLGDRHTLSVRKYPKNISVKMWKNSDKSGTTVSLKMPHDKFYFFAHIQELVNNFETELDVNSISILEEKWNYINRINSF